MLIAPLKILAGGAFLCGVKEAHVEGGTPGDVGPFTRQVVFIE